MEKALSEITLSARVPREAPLWGAGGQPRGRGWRAVGLSNGRGPRGPPEDYCTPSAPSAKMSLGASGGWFCQRMERMQPKNQNPLNPFNPLTPYSGSMVKVSG